MWNAGQIVVASLLDRNVKLRLILRDPEKATTLFGEHDEEKFQVCSYVAVPNLSTLNPGPINRESILAQLTGKVFFV